ncbi:nucleoside recognition domain-containing protein [Cytobacillus sp. IB215316]|uniref:nucleoside recognition domain-containing protein n=1 Tax=Cytobacillus sp. IB215316 TaxID=3097354 RepID=UPI002A1816AC|nr:nucleoside recognition domain-containing protein [Cytobacillus sp. IB215316]MDX8360619.1 nucleoside recognition domain-containing protein [Cytobacillus sp. IB215316]
MVGSVKKGFIVGLQTTWTLGKIIFPVTLIVTILQYTVILQWIMKSISPLMGLFGLSGDAAIPLVLGNFLNLYAAIGAILTLDLTVKEVFILAVMLSFSHNLIIESSVAARVGVKLWIMMVTRIGLAVISAFMINILWAGGNELAQYGLISKEEEVVTGWGSIIVAGVEKGLIGILQLALIVIPLMIGIQILKDLKWLETFSKWMSPLTKLLGMKENTSTTLAAGLLFGLAYGSGVMIQAVKEDGVSKKDTVLAFIFLVSCHAVIEDTLVFIPLGIPILPLLLIRVFVAILLTMIVAFIWKKAELHNRKEANYDH